MNLSNLLKFDYWLDASVTAQPAGRSMWLAAAICIAAALVFALLARRHRAVYLPLAVAAGLAGAVAIGRVFQIPVLGWRIGWLLAGLLATMPPLLRAARAAAHDGLFSHAFAALAFKQAAADSPDWRPTTALLWTGAHAFALLITFANLPPFQIPNLRAWFALPLLLACAPLLFARRRKLRHLSGLAPLTYAYGVAAFSATRLQFDGPLNGLLYLPLALIVSSAIAIAAVWRQTRSDDEAGFVQAGAALLIAASLGWSIWSASSLRTHGVSGSDPYAYTQMGVDLAERGTLAHAFPLVRLTYALNIDSHPVTHIGYRIPADVRRVAPTVWPIGYAWFTALAWRIAGESGVFWLTPLFGLLALAIVGAWARLMTARMGAAPSVAIAALCVFLTATSYQQVEWQMIPMADIASQVFSIGALSLAWLGGRSAAPRSRIVWALFAGVALGMAFNIRYTQVLIAPALALALWPASASTTQRIGASALPVLVCGLAALLCVLPTFWYHWTWFGHPLVTGSEELSNFSLTRMPETVMRALSDWNWVREYGLLTPLMAAGAAALWRICRRESLVALAYALPVFALHAFYDYLRLRDLLSIFPVLSLCAAAGAVALWRWSEQRGHGLLRTSLLFAISFVFVLRSMETLAMPATRGFSAFGYLVREQRASFGRLAQLTEPDAVIGSSLNSGAVDLHAGRLTFRPGVWDARSRAIFVEALLGEGRPVYVLIDGEDMRAAEADLRAKFTLTEVARLDMPYFFKGSGSENRAAPLYRVR